MRDKIRDMMNMITYIPLLSAVVDAWNVWECLCGSSLCEWCSHPAPAPVWLYGARGGAEWTGEDMITRYDIPVGSLVNGV